MSASSDFIEYIIELLEPIADDAGPIAGIYGAIFVGFFAALFGGTPS